MAVKPVNKNISRIVLNILSKHRFGIGCNTKEDSLQLMQEYGNTLDCDIKNTICLPPEKNCDISNHKICQLTVTNISFLNGDEDTIKFSTDILEGTAPFTITWEYDTNVLELATVHGPTTIEEINLRWIHGRPEQIITNIKFTITDSFGCSAIKMCQFKSDSEIVSMVRVYTESMSCITIEGCNIPNNVTVVNQAANSFDIDFLGNYLTDIVVYNNSNNILQQDYGISDLYHVNYSPYAIKKIVMTYHCPDGTISQRTFDEFYCLPHVGSVYTYSADYNPTTNLITHTIRITAPAMSGDIIDLQVKNTTTGQQNTFLDVSNLHTNYVSQCSNVSCSFIAGNDFPGLPVPMQPGDYIEINVRRTCETGVVGEWANIGNIGLFYDWYKASVDMTGLSTILLVNSSLTISQFFIDGVNVIGVPVVIGTFPTTTPRYVITQALIAWLNSNINQILVFKTIVTGANTERYILDVVNTGNVLPLPQPVVPNSMAFSIGAANFSFTFTPCTYFNPTINTTVVC